MHADVVGVRARAGPMILLFSPLSFPPAAIDNFFLSPSAFFLARGKSASNGNATVYGTGNGLPITMQAFAGGVLSRGCEINEGLPRASLFGGGLISGPRWAGEFRRGKKRATKKTRG